MNLVSNPIPLIISIGFGGIFCHSKKRKTTMAKREVYETCRENTANCAKSAVKILHCDASNLAVYVNKADSDKDHSLASREEELDKKMALHHFSISENQKGEERPRQKSDTEMSM
jgi:hypothetical protein